MKQIERESRGLIEIEILSKHKIKKRREEKKMKVTVHAFCDDTYLRNIEERGWVVSIDTESRCILKYYKEHREAGEDYLFLINKKE